MSKASHCVSILFSPVASTVMTRMASPSSIVVLLALVAQSHGAVTCEDKMHELTAELAAMKKAYAELESKLADAQDDTYVTAQAIADVGGDVLESLGAGKLDLGALPQINISDKIDVTQVTAAISVGYDAATETIMSAVGKAQALHKEHVLPHADEYYKATEPHIASISKAYYDQVHPHVADVYKKIGAGVEETKTGLKEKFKVVFEQATLTVGAAFEGTDTSSTYLNKLYEPREIQFLSYKKVFTHGCLDIALFFVQFITNLYVGLLILWQVWKIFFWRFGYKFGFGTAKLGVKISFGLTTTTVSIAFKVFFTLFSVIFWTFMLGIFCALGVSIMHGIEKNAKAGLDVNLRLAAGAGVGALLFAIIYCCCCCKKRAAKKDKGDPKAAAKANASKGAKPKSDAKSEPKKEDPKAKTASKPKGKK
jgi:hypothetical protein